MSDDKLLPPVLNRLHPRFNTPWVSIVICSIVVSLMVLWTFADLLIIDVTVYGAGLFLEYISVIKLRFTEPDTPRPFKTPWVPVVPILGIITCLVMMVSLPLGTWIRLFVWLVIGLAVYFFYGRKNSVVRKSSAG